MPLRKPRRAGKLLATGQLTSYVDYDDGYYKKGLAKSYTILIAGQYSGSTDIVLNAKTDEHSNECVLDNNTGLMWSRNGSDSVGPDSDGNLPFTTNVNGEGIFAFCAAANAAALSGYSDWRVPNLMEVLSLVDYEVPNGKPDVTAFPSVSSYWYTTTTYLPDTSKAYYINMANGLNPATPKTDTNTVFLVRG